MTLFHALLRIADADPELLLSDGSRVEDAPHLLEDLSAPESERVLQREVCLLRIFGRYVIREIRSNGRAGDAIYRQA